MQNVLMVARLDLQLVHRLAASFPGGEAWQAVSARNFVADRSDRLHSNWTPIEHLKGVGGVYAVLLPASWFCPARTLPLHAPHRHQGIRIPFEFGLAEHTSDSYGVVYVGRTSNLSQRWRGHLTPGDRKDGGQVKYGLVDCGIHANPEDALRNLRANARVVYTVLSGPEQCAIVTS